jgi:hypothetical protein
MASSAGHVAGHNLSSSESATWLRDHWKVSLAYVKPELDRILADGINHIFYHGTVFSPQDAPWPGWLFYASTQFQPNNTWWDDFGALNRYIGRVQSILQRGQPGSDILLYWPINDIWDDSDGLLKMLGVHDVKWLTGQPVGKIARTLMERGYSFDYISDEQLQHTRHEARDLVTRGGRYKVLLVPATRRMPVATLRRIVSLAQDGATVILEQLPEDVPGYGHLDKRRKEFKEVLGAIGPRLVVSGDVPGALATTAATREPGVEAGLSFIRRVTAHGHDYFFANLSARRVDGWISLGTPAARAVILDPLSGRTGRAALQSDPDHRARIYLQLAPGESLIVRTSRDDASRRGEEHATGDAGATEASKQFHSAIAQPWPYREVSGSPLALAGKWSITFTKGGPSLPAAMETMTLASWTELGDDEAKRFGGTARYRIEFEAPAARAGDWLLDLGEVRESARVRLN